MIGWNLPPGCSESDIPGNRPEDMAFEEFWEKRIDRIYEEWKIEHEAQYDNPDDEYDKNIRFHDHVEALFEDSLTDGCE